MTKGNTKGVNNFLLFHLLMSLKIMSSLTALCVVLALLG